MSNFSSIAIRIIDMSRESMLRDSSVASSTSWLSSTKDSLMISARSVSRISWLAPAMSPPAVVVNDEYSTLTQRCINMVAGNACRFPWRFCHVHLGMPIRKVAYISRQYRAGKHQWPYQAAFFVPLGEFGPHSDRPDASMGRQTPCQPAGRQPWLCP